MKADRDLLIRTAEIEADALAGIAREAKNRGVLIALGSGELIQVPPGKVTALLALVGR